jgi:hypothetical protein
MMTTASFVYILRAASLPSPQYFDAFSRSSGPSSLCFIMSWPRDEYIFCLCRPFRSHSPFVNFHEAFKVNAQGFLKLKWNFLSNCFRSSRGKKSDERARKSRK